MQFLFPDSASLELLGQTSESLAGRVAYAELAGINTLEVRNSERKGVDENSLWLRGGFPESLLAKTGSVSLQWRYDLIRSYLDILVDLLLVRRLPPWYSNTGKRLVKSPRIFVRDTGLLHALLDISTMHDYLGHPVVGHSR
jgi:predicted AAA+ superfamily ATPase